MQLRFLGAAGTVTGSRYLVDSGDERLLVDCGLFQGLKALRLKNWRPLGVSPDGLAGVVLTHAHIDHSGYLPLLVKQGFAGKVYCSLATKHLLQVLLPDAAHLQEEDARHANRHGYSKHKPALPLYTVADAKLALSHLHEVDFGERFKVGHFDVRLMPAGHILGAASVEIRRNKRTLLFSGDLGRPNDALMPPPAKPTNSDYIVVESTYGNRRHGAADAEAQLADVITKTHQRGGVVIIPAFAVGRAQALLLHLQRLRQASRIPDVPIFLNSPMATAVMRLYERHMGEHRLSAAEVEAMNRIAHVVTSSEDSQRLNERDGSMVIIAGSGMATGGRVVFHLERFLPDPRNTVLLSGFQAAGTRGASLAAGAEDVTIHGQSVPVRAHIVQLDQMSAHADASEIVDWLRALDQPPRRVFITHGEPAAADALRHRIEQTLGWSCLVPAQDDQVQLT